MKFRHVGDVLQIGNGEDILSREKVAHHLNSAARGLEVARGHTHGKEGRDHEKRGIEGMHTAMSDHEQEASIEQWRIIDGKTAIRERKDEWTFNHDQGEVFSSSSCNFFQLWWFIACFLFRRQGKVSSLFGSVIISDWKGN